MERLTLFTFGDSVLDSGVYNEHGLDAGQLLVRNDDRLFPEFAGRDLSRRWDARIDHRARDGAVSSDLHAQLPEVLEGRAAALLSIGGNDLLAFVLGIDRNALAVFERNVRAFLEALTVRPVLVANVYDPSFGDDRMSFLPGVAPGPLRKRHATVNDLLGRLGDECGGRVDLHAHFLTGDQSWFTRTIEPSLRGASEVRRCFLAALDRIGVA